MMSFLISCKSDKIIKHSTITEVYEVKGNANERSAKGPLKYMEWEEYEGEKLLVKSYYNANQTVKGREVYQYSNEGIRPSGSLYYDSEGALQSTYKFSYVDTLKSRVEAFAGDTDELLRIERFQYDTNGNMVVRMILEADESPQRIFRFGHDEFGNEVNMTMTDGSGNKLLTETYEIVTIDEQNRWVEKFGYLNDDSLPITFYNIRRNDLRQKEIK